MWAPLGPVSQRPALASIPFAACRSGIGHVAFCARPLGPTTLHIARPQSGLQSACFQSPLQQRRGPGALSVGRWNVRLECRIALYLIANWQSGDYRTSSKLAGRHHESTLLLFPPGFGLLGPLRQLFTGWKPPPLTVAQNAKNSLGCTLHGTRRKRARVSGFRTRRRTPGGRRVLARRRRKGRKVLCPAGKPRIK